MTKTEVSTNPSLFSSCIKSLTDIFALCSCLFFSTSFQFYNISEEIWPCLTRYTVLCWVSSRIYSTIQNVSALLHIYSYIACAQTALGEMSCVLHIREQQVCVCVRVRCFMCGHVRAVAVERDSVSTSTPDIKGNVLCSRSCAHLLKPTGTKSDRAPRDESLPSTRLKGLISCWGRKSVSCTSWAHHFYRLTKFLLWIKPELKEIMLIANKSTHM